MTSAESRESCDVRRLRVAVITRAIYPWHGYGGLERHAYDLVRSLLRQDVDVTLITRQIGSSATRVDLEHHPHLTRYTVPYRTFPLAGRRGTTVIDRSTAYPLFGERAGRLAAQLATRRQVDIVYGVGASALGYARARSRDRRGTVPFVFNPQGLEEFGATDPRRARLKRLAYRPLQRAVRACARAADCVIATDRTLEPTLLEHLRIDRSRVRVIPNAIDLEACDQTAGAREGSRVRAEVGFGAHDRLLLSVGRLEKNKGFHVLAQGLAEVGCHPRAEAAQQGAPPSPDRRNAIGTWHWVLAGEGPYRGRLERQLRGAGFGSYVTLVGAVETPRLHALYEAADLFVHPTLYEGSSLVTLEAMAHRRPVVATEAGGLRDKVMPGRNGWLVPPGDAAELARALNEALATPGERLRAMGCASRTIVEEQFSWDVVTPKFLALFEELLKESAGR
ncbi:MAG: glycosyltransferase family 4 protein [Acidobacteria bacterium]|nr:glycosyltransferase family 4 protein [Acidobacteriota bacterium]